MEVANRYENDLNFKATELRLGLPGTEDEPEKLLFKSNKRSSPEINSSEKQSDSSAAPPKAQVIGWPPVRSYRKNAITQQKKIDLEGSGIYVKVSMDGAPYLRKIDLRIYKSYGELVKGLENMFKCNIGEFHEREGYNSGGGSKNHHHDNLTPTYEDKDGDWMLVGDVPWDMFLTSCKRMRIMKSSDANGIICS